MSFSESKKSGLKKGVARRLVSVSQESLIGIAPLSGDSHLPLVVRPKRSGLLLVDWAASNLEMIESLLKIHGALLFRGFSLKSIPEFESFMGTVCGDLLDYKYRSTPRTSLMGKVYSSTEYPADQHILLHNEMSYTRTWPMRIFFHCVKPAEAGGETPIADSRRVLARLSADVIERFARDGLLYVRNYGGGLDLSWQNVFQTDSKGAVEQYCKQAGIEFEWRAENKLRTRQLCQALAKHPITGEDVWFNQAHLFHISNLPASVLESLRGEFSDDDLPRNVYYGDGSAIESPALEEIRSAYDREAVAFGWEPRDVLMLDNMLAAHGRRPYNGDRKIVVGMGQAFTNPIPN